MIKTAKVTGRRSLRFETLRDIQSEVEGLASAHEIQTLGNWSAGQILKHLAIVMHGAIDGLEVTIPLHMRLALPVALIFMKHGILNRPMSAGLPLPSSAAKVIIPPATSFEEGLAAIRSGLQRLTEESNRKPHPLLGHLTREEWDKLHCRHCEMHLSFLIPSHVTPARQDAPS